MTNQTEPRSITTAGGQIVVDRTPGALNARAQAALCALRTGTRFAMEVGQAIGDERPSDAISLLEELACLGLVARAGTLWGLTHDGIGWLETSGVVVSKYAKRWATREEDGSNG